MVDQAASGSPDLIVLPECAYPAYYLAGRSAMQSRGGLRAGKDVLDLFARKARQTGVYLAIGIAEEAADGSLYNSAFLFDSRGNIAGHARKQFLWHFDAQWFTTGDTFTVTETPWGPMGMLICADGRNPEIARILALKGAKMIIDVTNWVAAGKDHARLINAQAEFMLKARALENNVWMVAADKVGLEEASILYCGRSMLISPSGEVVAQGSSDKAEIVTAEIPLPLDDTHHQHSSSLEPVVRRPETYYPIVQPVEELSVSQTVREAIIPGEKCLFVSAMQIDLGKDIDHLLTGMDQLIRALAVQGSKVIVLPEPVAGQPVLRESERVLAFLKRLTGELGIAVLFTGSDNSRPKPHKTAFFIKDGAVNASYQKMHLDPGERSHFTPGDSGYTIVSHEKGNLGIMLGFEGWLPEVARVLTLRGADVILWPCCFKGEHHEAIMRTRSAENRVFHVVCNASTHAEGGLSAIVNPNGTILAQAGKGLEHAVSSMLVVAEARSKELVPGTDVIFDRKPSLYGRIVEQEAMK